MNTGSGSGIGAVNPSEAWELLTNDTGAMLVDVRTQAEWAFVGVPDLSALGRSLICVEWARYPGMSANQAFCEQVIEALGGDVPDTLLFMCRSGVRSLHAAEAIAAHLSAAGKQVTCLNVAEGFEGDLDPQHHRGASNGWKSRGLAWCQS